MVERFSSTVIPSGGGGGRKGMIKSSRKRIWKGNVVCVREKINSHRVLVGISEVRRLLGRFRGKGNGS